MAEPWKPGGDLPTPKPLPEDGKAVEAVDGPLGPIYPDGYTTEPKKPDPYEGLRRPPPLPASTPPTSTSIPEPS